MKNFNKNKTYFKITNSDETHNGLKYKTGLNVDILDFRPEGDCEGGGIYFAAEDIFAFLNYGPYVREVTLPSEARVYKNPNEPKKWKADKVILGERRVLADVETIKWMIKAGASVHACDDYALRWAAGKGHLEVTEALIQAGANVNADGDWALRWAAYKGNLEIVKLLLDSGASVSACDDSALRWAAGNGHLEIVKLLLDSGASVNACEDSAFRWAAGDGHLEVVKLLLDSGAGHISEAIEEASYWKPNNYKQIIEILQARLNS